MKLAEKHEQIIEIVNLWQRSGKLIGSLRKKTCWQWPSFCTGLGRVEVISTEILSKIEPFFDYLKHVLSSINSYPENEIDKLLPLNLEM
jgi:hypothetical protein